MRSLQHRQAPLDPSEPLFGEDVTLDPAYSVQRNRCNDGHCTGEGDNIESSSSEHGLFGVRGLTRPLLQACVQSYFKYAAPCMPILHAEVFAARYALFFVHYEKDKGVRPFWELPQEDATSVDRPLSLLLLLSVGCAGAALLEPPIADFNFKGKFRLQDRLALCFQREVNKYDLLLRLQHEGMDVVEACYIMSDPMLRVLGDDLPSKWMIDWSTVGEMDRSQRDPLRLRPASHEGIVRLIFKMSLNMSGKEREDVPPGDSRRWDCQGIFFDDREAFRRCRIFWSVFMQDAFRSMGERRNVLIGNDDYDLELPRLVPHAEGLYEAHFWHKPMVKVYDEKLERWQWDTSKKDGTQTRPSLYAKFDAYQLEVMLRLAFIVRTASIRFVSPRSKGRGVLVTDVERAVNALEAWYQQLPGIVTWEVQSEPLTLALLDGKTGSTNAKAMRNSLRALFVEFLFHGQVLAAWGSVDSFGIRQDTEMDEALDRFVKSLKLDDSTKSISIPDDSHESLNPTGSSSSPSGGIASASGSASKPAEDVRRAAKRKLDRLAAKSFLRVAKVSKEAARLGLVRAQRLIFTHIIGSYVLWGCGLARKLKAASAAGDRAASAFLLDVPPGYDQIEYLYKCIDDLIYAIGQIDSFEFVQERVKQLKELLVATKGSAAASPEQQTGRRASAEADDEDEDDTAHAPFRYIFHKGQVNRSNMNHLSKHYETAPKHKRRPSETSAQTSVCTSAYKMDMDEVSQLAHAANPYSGNVTSSDGISPFPDGAIDTPESSRGSVDQMLDLDLESITGMDTEWLHQYLQTSTLGQANKYPPLDVQKQQQQQAQHQQQQQNQQQQHLDLFGHYTLSSLAASEPTTTQPVAYPGNEHGLYNLDNLVHEYGGNPILTNAAPGAGGVTLDAQWDSFMANSDAQLWADAQWQGVTDNSMTV